MAMSARVVRLQNEGMKDSMAQVSCDGGRAKNGLLNAPESCVNRRSACFSWKLHREGRRLLPSGLESDPPACRGRPGIRVRDPSQAMGPRHFQLCSQVRFEEPARV